ncbi:MAG: riboflavin synthase [Gammaproteobacteria bacterium]|jgi:riboflavin synthase|nr:riboflavin synthase [Gammaproteobacteria bacterium]
MFTGIIEAVGRIGAVEPKSEDTRVRVEGGKLDLSGASLGDSIAVNGVCLTVTSMDAGGFWVDVSGETLSKTTFGGLRTGSAVNLEQALTPQSRLGGHLVSGHVDGIGHVTSRQPDGRSVRFTITVPDALAHYIATKGSVCLDGVSLTVNRVEGNAFDVNIIPHTLEETTLQDYQPGTRVNVEVDLLARYLERLLSRGSNTGAGGSGIDYELLAKHGFAG